MSQSKLPKITWGTSYANTLNFGYPIDNWNATVAPRDGSQWIQTESGVEDSWIIGFDHTISFDARWIPKTTTTTPLATGWNDAVSGWVHFLQWAMQKNVLRYFPDKSSGTYVECYLVEPMDGAHSLEPDGTRSIRLKLRSETAFAGY